VRRVLALAAGLAAIISLLSACGREPKLVPFADPVAQTRSVLVATSRAERGGTPPSYGGAPGTGLDFGAYRLSVPPERAPAELGLPGQVPDPAREFLWTGWAPLADEAAFVAALDARLARLPKADRRVLVYVHGYYTGFDSSVMVAAQVAEDYGHGGPVVAFSWPSAGRLLDYERDRAAARAARAPFAAVLRALARSTADSIVVLAHSMGAYLTMESLAVLQAQGEDAVLARLAAVVMAAPDIDAEAFAARVARLGPARPEIVVIGSGRDHVLQLSRFLAGGRYRLGGLRDLGALRRLGVYGVDVSDFDPGTIRGHFAFHRAPELVEMIRTGALAGALAQAAPGGEIVLEVPRADGDPARVVVFLP